MTPITRDLSSLSSDALNNWTTRAMRAVIQNETGSKRIRIRIWMATWLMARQIRRSECLSSSC